MRDIHRPRVRIIHETNPRKYYPAVYELAAHGRIDIVSENRNSVIKEWIRSWLIERRPFRQRMLNALNDSAFRMKIPFINGDVIILAFAPWDWRLALYSPLVLRNRVVYHTSWPYWQIGRTPRRYGPVDLPLRWFWRKVLAHPNVSAVAVLDAPRTALAQHMGVAAQVVPHAVPEIFYEARDLPTDRENTPLRLIFIGELSRKKGIDELLAIIRDFDSSEVTLTIIGEGPLRPACERAGARGEVRFLGPIADRPALACELADHDVLVLLSRRESDWEELFGIVLAEAMAAGLGVLASTHIGPVSLLAGTTDLGNLFDEDDNTGPREMIAKLARDPAFREKFKASHRVLSEEYRISRVAEAWADVLGAEGR